MPKTHLVEIKNFKYDPERVPVEVGDAVKWVNRDTAIHTATRSGEPTFDTGNLSKDQESSEIVFTGASDSAGFCYICTPHPFMTGTVVVTLPGSNKASYSLEAALEQHTHDKR